MLRRLCKILRNVTYRNCYVTDLRHVTLTHIFYLKEILGTGDDLYIFTFQEYIGTLCESLLNSDIDILISLGRFIITRLSLGTIKTKMQRLWQFFQINIFEILKP